MAPGIVLTCAHVVTNLSEDGALVGAHWDGTECVANLLEVRPAPYPDIALLSVSFAAHPCVDLYPDVRVGDRLYSFGYTRDYPDGDSITLEYEGPSGLSSTLLKLKGGQIVPGCSGAPLLNLRTGGICGVIKKRALGTDADLGSSLGGRAISSQTILAELDDLRTKQTEFHNNSGDWSFLLTAEQRKQRRLASHRSTAVPLTQASHHDASSLFRGVIAERNRLTAAFISGSDRVRVRDLLSTHSLLVGFRWRDYGEKQEHEKDLIGRLLTSMAEGDRVLVLSDPGMGKSTLTYALLDRLIEAWMEDEAQPIPVHIDLRDYTRDKEFGSRDWLAQFLSRLSGRPGSDFAGAEFGAGSTAPPALIVLDSLDEYLSMCDNNQAAAHLERFIFRQAALITCRTQYFERYLAMSEFARSFRKVRLAAWTALERQSYAECYYKCFFPDRSADLIRRAGERFDTSRQLSELSLVPLHLNMTLELMASDQFDPDQIGDLLGLYHAYVLSWLRREAARSGSTLDVEEKIALLQEISWHFYDEGQIGEESAASLSRSEIRKFLNARPEGLWGHSVEQVLLDLCTRTMLVEHDAGFTGSEPTSIRFIHKSFQEYFVASHLVSLMMDSDVGTAEAFRRFISPEVSEFLRESILKMASESWRLSRAVGNCMSAFGLCQGRLGETIGTDPARARIARQQIAYYLGNMRSKDASSFLEGLSEREPDLWVRRGSIVGLAIGGQEKHLHRYLDRLNEARTQDGDPTENDVNVGFTLSFFGDQPFDVFYPDKDQGFPACERTVSRTIYLLGTETDRGTWRLNLYTLLDIGMHRTASKQAFRSAMIEHLHEFERVIAKMRSDEKCRDWPEVARAEALIGQLRGNSGR